MAEPTVVIDQIVKHYGRHEALKGVSFTLLPGESIALVGHNGAGKTTLLKLMLGLTRPTSGTVRVLGEDPAASPAIRARHGIGFLPETVAFNPAALCSTCSRPPSTTSSPPLVAARAVRSSSPTASPRCCPRRPSTPMRSKGGATRSRAGSSISR